MVEHPKIERRPGVCGGRAVIEGTRIPVHLIVGFIKDGLSADEILGSYTDLSSEQVRAAIDYHAGHGEGLWQGSIYVSKGSMDLPGDRSGLLLNLFMAGASFPHSKVACPVAGPPERAWGTAAAALARPACTTCRPPRAPTPLCV
mgnify:CR=1 FL=1